MAGFGFASVGHFFASIVHDIKVGADFVEKHQAQINGAIETGAAVISLVDPALAPLTSTITRASETLLGDVLALIEKAGPAADAGGINLALDAATVASFKELLADIKKIKPSAANPPVGLPATA